MNPVLTPEQMIQTTQNQGLAVAIAIGAFLIGAAVLTYLILQQSKQMNHLRGRVEEQEKWKTDTAMGLVEKLGGHIQGSTETMRGLTRAVENLACSGSAGANRSAAHANGME